MQATPTMDKLVVDARAWRIDFVPACAKDQEPLVIVKEPANLIAAATAVEFADALAERRETRGLGNGKARAADEIQKPLLLLCLPPGSGLAGDIETRLEAWLQESSDRLVHPVRAGLRTSRVIWSSDRAIIYAGQDQMSDAMDAVLRFTVAARLTSRLENEMSATWPALDEHARLMHAITPQDQRLQPLVNSLTVRAAQMMSTLLRLEGSLEQLDPALPTASKRLFAELVQQGALYERLEILEDPIEHAGDVYEVANSRLTEAKAAAQNNKLEKLIILLLAAELAVMIYGVLAPGGYINYLFGY